MFATLVKLIPFRDYAYAALAAAAIVFWFHHDAVEQKKGAAHEIAAVQAATAKVQAAAEAQIKQKDSEYASNLAKVTSGYEEELSLDAGQHDADLQRLRDADTSHSSAHSAVGSAGPAHAGPAPGTASAGGLGSVPADIALGLADALRHDDAELKECWADRDELTGK
jgi:hypothetical protein